MGVMEKLTNAALDAFEDELKCWQRIGTWSPKTTMLVRNPMLGSLGPIGPAEVTAESTMTIDRIELPDHEVHMFIVRAAMEKAVIAIKEELRA